MRKLISAARKRPYTVSRNKFYKAIAYRDTLTTVYVKDVGRGLTDNCKAWAENNDLDSTGYGVSGVYSSRGDASYCYINFQDALADNTSFKREQLPAIVKYLAEPLNRLRK